MLPLAASMLERGVSADEVRAAVPAERPSARLLLATALYEAGHSTEAEAGFRAVLVANPDDRYFVLLVEHGRDDAFERYRLREELRIVAWLDSTEALERLEHGIERE